MTITNTTQPLISGGFAGYRIKRVTSDDDVTFAFPRGADSELLFTLLDATEGTNIVEVYTPNIAPALAKLRRHRTAYEHVYGAELVVDTRIVLTKMRDQMGDHGAFILYEVLF